MEHQEVGALSTMSSSDLGHYSEARLLVAGAGDQWHRVGPRRAVLVPTWQIFTLRLNKTR